MSENLVLLSLSRSELKEIIGDAVRTELEIHPPQVIQTREEEQLLSREETARLLKISLVTLHDRMRKGELPFTRSGRRVLFIKSEIMKKLTEHRK